MVDWTTVSYTYSSDQTFGDPTSAAKIDAPASTSTAAAPPPVSTTAAPAPASTPPPASTPTPSAVAAVVNVASEVLAPADASKLISIGFAAVGINADNAGGGVWIGPDGPYTNEFTNNAGEDLILAIWGAAGSWVNRNTPLITHSLPIGSSVTISFATGQSGAWAAVYADTTLFDGQIINTWGEYTFSPDGVVDVSREPDMNGHGMSIVGPQCTSDMNTCVFQCKDGATSCETDYELLNCAPKSQPGAQYGLFDGNASGGCGWPGATTAALKTTFN